MTIKKRLTAKQEEDTVLTKPRCLRNNPNCFRLYEVARILLVTPYGQV
jgi:hypothetical protein